MDVLQHCLKGLSSSAPSSPALNAGAGLAHPAHSHITQEPCSAIACGERVNKKNILSPLSIDLGLGMGAKCDRKELAFVGALLGLGV